MFVLFIFLSRIFVRSLSLSSGESTNLLMGAVKYDSVEASQFLSAGRSRTD